jgi:serine/threonine-protein kinase
MSEPHLSPVALALQVDAVCLRFEKAWKAGENPRLEDYLAHLPEAGQARLFQELLALELAYRQRAGEPLDTEEYRRRFPDRQPAIQAAFAELALPAADSDVSGRTPSEGVTGPFQPDLEVYDPHTVIPPTAPADGIPPRVGGYLIEGEIACGGIGIVLRARDPRFRRRLAVKVLQARHADQPDLVQRFLEEAQVMGQLQHPGVPPVHDLGELEDGRPFFAMKLIQGRTLAQLLKERKEPGQDLPRFLAVFEQVCQAVAYAHSKGVIHRDLKPSNVMVGTFGEVQVMDWGFAKVLGQERTTETAEEETSTIATARTEAPGQSSQVGTVLGTPAYMAPEQARGEVERLNERCDVFGLGAILCQILTGSPPYRGPDRQAVVQQAMEGNLAGAWARLEGCGAEAELVQLAGGCLAAGRDDRPEDAGKVAQAMAAYRVGVEERLRAAELERAQAMVKDQEERKRRKLAVGLAAAVLALLILIGGGWLWLEWQATLREQELRQGTKAALEKAAGLQKESRWKEARAVLEQELDRVGDTGPVYLRQRLAKKRTDLILVGRLDDAHLKAATWLQDHFDIGAAERDYTTAFRKAGLGQPGEDVQVVAARVRGSAVREQLVAALDDWAQMTEDQRRLAWLLAVARQADPDPWRDRFRDPRVWQDRLALERLAREVRVAQLSPQLLTNLAKLLFRSGGDGMPYLKAAQARYPQDFWLNFILANAFHAARQIEEAIAYYRAALSLRSLTIPVYNNLGAALQAKGQLDEAIACFHKALALNPKYAPAHGNLGLALHAKGDLDGAIACWQKALALDPKLAQAHYSLGNALHQQGQLDEAIACYRQTLTLIPKYAEAHTHLGNALYEKDRAEEAIACHRKAIALNPKLAKAHTSLGNALAAQGQLEKAVACHRKAIALSPRYAKAHNNLGTALYAKKDVAGAIACYRQALALDPRYATAYTNLGVALMGKGDLSAAIACCHKALAMEPQSALARATLALALLRQGHFAAAQRAGQHALDLLPARAPLRTQMTRHLQFCERLLLLDSKLQAVLKREARPRTVIEALALGRLCQLYKRFYVASVRFYTDAFAAEPKRANEFRLGARFNAACAAACAAAGQGEDANKLDEKERTRLRRQALNWLQADLKAWTAILEKGIAQDQTPAQRMLIRWQGDPALASLRDEAGLAWLPEDERRACRQLWADVASLLQRARSAR